MLPLTMARAGENVEIARISGSEEVRQHLYELGFTVGQELNIISDVSGSLIVQVKDSRIALDRSMVSKIFVNITN